MIAILILDEVDVPQKGFGPFNGCCCHKCLCAKKKGSVCRDGVGRGASASATEDVDVDVQLIANKRTSCVLLQFPLLFGAGTVITFGSKTTGSGSRIELLVLLCCRRRAGIRKWLLSVCLDAFQCENPESTRRG